MSKKLPSEDVVTKEGSKEAIALQYENSFSLQQIILICNSNQKTMSLHIEVGSMSNQVRNSSS